MRHLPSAFGSVWTPVFSGARVCPLLTRHEPSGQPVPAPQAPHCHRKSMRLAVQPHPKVTEFSPVVKGKIAIERIADVLFGGTLQCRIQQLPASRGTQSKALWAPCKLALSSGLGPGVGATSGRLGIRTSAGRAPARPKALDANSSSSTRRELLPGFWRVCGHEGEGSHLGLPSKEGRRRLRRPVQQRGRGFPPRCQPRAGATWRYSGALRPVPGSLAEPTHSSRTSGSDLHPRPLRATADNACHWNGSPRAKRERGPQTYSHLLQPLFESTSPSLLAAVLELPLHCTLMATCLHRLGCRQQNTEASFLATGAKLLTYEQPTPPPV